MSANPPTAIGALATPLSASSNLFLYEVCVPTVREGLTYRIEKGQFDFRGFAFVCRTGQFGRSISSPRLSLNYYKCVMTVLLRSWGFCEQVKVWFVYE